MYAKLSPPRFAAPVPRTRLFAELDSLGDAAMLWISGPPGSGKTTLVGSYLEARQISAYWYHVDDTDRDPASVFFYLGELLKQTELAREGDKLPYLSPEYLPDLPAFARRYFRELFARLAPRSVFVFDNCHEAQSDSFHGLLREAAAELPPQVRLILLAHTPPAPSLARFRLSGQLRQLGWDNLRLDLDESRAICAQRAPGLSDKQLTQLHHDVDGWVAGLILLAAYRPLAVDAQQPQTSMSREALFDYFAGEVLDRAAPDQRTVLMRTALLPQIDEQIATRLSGVPRAAQVLRDLTQRQYFIERRGGNGSPPRYQYHNLFRDFLRTRLEDTLSLVELNELRTKTAALLADVEQYDDAVALWLEAEHFDHAVNAIDKLAPQLIEQGRNQLLLAWLRQLPKACLVENPWLGYWQANAQLHSSPPAALASFDASFQRFENLGERRGQLLAASGAMQAIAFQSLAFSASDPWIAAFERLIPTMTQFASIDDQAQAWSVFLHACTKRVPTHALMEQAANWLARYALEDSVPLARRLACASPVLTYDYMSANTARIERLSRALHAAATQESQPSISRSFWLMYLGIAELLQGCHAEASQTLHEARVIARDHGFAFGEYASSAFRAYCCIALGDIGAARDELNSTSAVVETARLQVRFLYNKGEAMLASHLGQYSGAMEFGQRALAEVEEIGHVSLNAILRTDLTPVAIAAGKLDLAR